MSQDSMAAKFLRFVGILFMGLAVLFTLLGGAGTTCAALTPWKWSSMAPLAPFQWLYQLLVVISLAVGVWGIWALVGLIRGTRQAYRDTLIVLLVGGLAALVQIVASRWLRGKSMPTDIRFYITLVALLLFLLFRLPGIWQGVNFDRGARSSGSVGPAGGATAFVAGLLMLTVQYWAGPTHTWEGINYADAWHLPMILGGIGLSLAGLVWLAWVVVRCKLASHRELAVALGPTQG